MDKESIIPTKEGKISRSVEGVAHKLDELADNAQELYQRGKERAGAFRESVDHYVQERPMKSLLIAGGVGVILGLLLSRRGS